jgi:hypothetical protein
VECNTLEEFLISIWEEEGVNDMLFLEGGAHADFRVSFRVWDCLGQNFPRM